MEIDRDDPTILADFIEFALFPGLYRVTADLSDSEEITVFPAVVLRRSPVTPT